MLDMLHGICALTISATFYDPILRSTYNGRGKLLVYRAGSFFVGVILIRFLMSHFVFFITYRCLDLDLSVSHTVQISNLLVHITISISLGEAKETIFWPGGNLPKPQ